MRRRKEWAKKQRNKEKKEIESMMKRERTRKAGNYKRRKMNQEDVKDKPSNPLVCR